MTATSKPATAAMIDAAARSAAMVLSTTGSSDDGNLEASDGCDDCMTEACGNGVVDAGEDCDDGDQSEACDEDCSAPECGDGTVNNLAGEACDDGNDVDGDGCSASCGIEDGDGGVFPDGGMADAGTNGGVSGGACGCSIPGQPRPLGPLSLMVVGLILAMVRRRS